MATLVIVDDSARFRVAARALLEAEGWTVVGEAADGAGAVRMCAELEPVGALVDIGLPDLDGFAVAHALARLSPRPWVVLCSSRPERAFRGRLARAAVQGFIGKDQLSGRRLAELVAGAR
jgi:DNA-binding NarL/FixJ family response regulator